MDLNSMHPQNQRSLILQEKAASAEERQAYVQFARDHSVQITMTRTRGGAPDAVCGFSK
jgi:hypothetical protein